MTTTPLPPLPRITEDPFRHYTAAQLQAYAQQARADLEAEVARLKAEYERACGLVADMHAAATGAMSGPKRGVVEDVADLRAENKRLRDALRNLLDDTQHAEHPDCEDGPCPVREARNTLETTK